MLFRRQKKFAKWMNSAAGAAYDLAVALKIDTELGPIDLQLVLSGAAFTFTAEGAEHHVRVVVEPEGQAELVILTDQGASFRAAFPIDENRFGSNLNLIDQPQSDPFAKTGSIGMGLGFGVG